jgi:two-component system CheB/CheR fusion protein
MRIKPYRTRNNVIDGVVITFVDIHEQKQMQQALRDARKYAESIVNTVPTPLIVLDADLKVISANRCFYQTFKVARQSTEGELIYELGNGQWDIPKFRELLEEILPDETTVEDFTVEHDFPNIGKRTISINARRLHQESEDSQMILVAIDDVTES